MDISHVAIKEMIVNGIGLTLHQGRLMMENGRLSSHEKPDGTIELRFSATVKKVPDAVG